MVRALISLRRDSRQIALGSAGSTKNTGALLEEPALRLHRAPASARADDNVLMLGNTSGRTFAPGSMLRRRAHDCGQVLSPESKPPSKKRGCKRESLFTAPVADSAARNVGICLTRPSRRHAIPQVSNWPVRRRRDLFSPIQSLARPDP